MTGLKTYLAATLLSGLAISANAFAAAPDALTEPVGTPGGFAAISAADPYRLDTEMTVRNWTLCISADGAESLVRAHEEGEAKADAVYAALQAKKACGPFPEMNVILQESVYVPAPDAAYQAHVFGALIKFSGQWAKGFVVSGE